MLFYLKFYFKEELCGEEHQSFLLKKYQVLKRIRSKKQKTSLTLAI